MKKHLLPLLIVFVIIGLFTAPSASFVLLLCQIFAYSCITLACVFAYTALVVALDKDMNMGKNCPADVFPFLSKFGGQW